MALPASSPTLTTVLTTGFLITGSTRIGGIDTGGIFTGGTGIRIGGTAGIGTGIRTGGTRILIRRLRLRPPKIPSLCSIMDASRVSMTM